MNKMIFKSCMLVIATGLFLALIGCGDGSHAGRAAWTQLGGAAGAGLSGNVGVPALECVDVTNYKSFDREYPDAEEAPPPPADEDVADGEGQPSGGGVAPGNNPFRGASDAMSTMLKSSPGYNIDEDEEAAEEEEEEKTEEEIAAEEAEATKRMIRACVENEIESLGKCGPSCRTYWGAATWLLTRDRLYTKPKKSEVNIVPFTSCKQVKLSECLLID